MDFDNNDTIEKLALAVFTRLRSIQNGEEFDLQSLVDEAIDFSIKNSIPSEVLLEGFNIYFSNNIFSAAFIYADAAAGMSTGKIKSIAHCNPTLTVRINTSVLSLFGVIKHANKTKNI